MTIAKKIFVAAFILTSLAPIASAQEKPQVQNFFIRCTSSGEKCDKSARLPLPSGTGNWALSLTAPAQHCSDVQYVVNTTKTGTVGSGSRYGKVQYYVELWRSGWLSAGGTGNYQFVAGSYPVVFITAEGRQGGCNQGALGSWGVAVKFTAN